VGAEENPSSTSVSSSTSPSSSPPLDQSLVRVFGALEQVLTDLTTAAQASFTVSREVAQKVSELSQRLTDRGKLDDKQREAVLEALVKLTEGFDKFTRQGDLATAETRKTLLEVKEEIDERLREVRDEVTGSHALLPRDDPEGPPRFVQVVVLKLTNLGWRNKAKVAAWIAAGAGAQPVLVKLKLLFAYLFGAH
jgi:hypothetical protein